MTFAAIKLAQAIVRVLMLAVGTFQIIETLTALSRHTYHADNNGLVLRVYCTEWGWIHCSDLRIMPMLNRIPLWGRGFVLVRSA